MTYGDPIRSRISRGQRYPCLRCDAPRLRWDPEDQEWCCPTCGGRFPDRSTDPEAALAGPVERVQAEQPPVVFEQPRTACVRIGSLPGLRCLRRIRRWTQEDLALLIESNRNSISDWENGHSDPSLQMVFRLLDVGQVTLEALRCRGECKVLQNT